MSDYLSLEQLPFDDEFKNALGELEQKIFDSYDHSCHQKKSEDESRIQRGSRYAWAEISKSGYG